MSAERIFKTDQEVLETALREFKSEKAVFHQEVVGVEGGLSFGQRRYFEEGIDLTRWIWKSPRTVKYVAVTMTDTAQKLTYTGNTFVVSYKDIVENPTITYFKAFRDTPPMKIDDKLLRESAAQIIRLLEAA